jgi:hypothetical protein
VGQQVTLDGTNAGVVGSRIDLLIARADTPFVSSILGAGVHECDLVVKGRVGGVEKGWLFEPSPNTFRPDDGGPNVTDAALRAQATPAQPLTYTCVTPGAGLRAGIERDRDAVLDGADNCPDVANVGQADGDTDGEGDACDNCVAKSNASQSDLDSDGTGDVCDAQCIGVAITSLSPTNPVSGPSGTTVGINGTGLGPNVEIYIGGVLAPTSSPFGFLVATVPTLANGTYDVVAVNPEGCQSQESVTFQVTPPSSSCGLTGFELFLVMASLGAGRRRLRRVVSRA